MTSRYGNHTFTNGPSLSVCMSSEMSLRILNMFSYRGQGNPGLKCLHMTDDLDIPLRSHSPVKLNSNIKHTTLLIFTSRLAEPHQNIQNIQVSQNVCHKLLLVIPHPLIKQKSSYQHGSKSEQVPRYPLTFTCWYPLSIT